VASNDSHSQKSKDFWNYLEENYKEVTNWPSWMKGESASQNGGSTKVQCPAAVKGDQKQG
jgi:hypothetical protein